MIHLCQGDNLMALGSEQKWIKIPEHVSFVAKKPIRINTRF
jgi:hypothetical protein